MGILNRLTIKHLLMNKKRTIVTIIGITLSMALMLGCGLLASSLIEAMKKETIQLNGPHHIEFVDVSKETAQTIQNNIHVKDSYFYSSLGFAEFKESSNDGKPYYYFVGANEKLLESLDLIEGRLPRNEEEILISEHIGYNGNVYYHVGDTLEINLGTRYQMGEPVFENVMYDEELDDKILNTTSKTYTIVGVVSRSYVEDYSAAGYTIFTKQDTLNSEHNHLLVLFHKPKDTFQIGEEIQASLSLDDNQVFYNSGVLYYYGTTRYKNINTSILRVLSIALGLLSIGCIIVIYNSFAISTMERKKQFGLYSSIGATKKQILHTVFFEAFVVGIIGIVLGILGSFLGIYIVLQILNYLLKNFWEYEFTLVINWIYILVPILFMIFVVFFSALIPAKRASRVTPIEAIRENDDIKLPKRKLRTPKFVTKLFGIEGELALKNMKRNKKKYRITVLSLFISIVLFISFSAYLLYGVSTMDSIDIYDYDISLYVRNEDVDAIFGEIQEDPRVTTSYIYSANSLTYTIPMDSYTKEYQEYRKYYADVDGSTDFGDLQLIILEDSDFTNYANKVSAPYEDIILINEGQFVFYQDHNRISYHQELFAKSFEQLDVCYDINNCKKSSLGVFLTKTVLPNFNHVLYNNSLIGFVSKSRYLELVNSGILPNSDDSDLKFMLLQANDYESLYKELTDKYKGRDYSISSPKQDFKQEQNMILAIKILLYGFISLVSLIGITSVFNTIHTSINLRRKEFAMLRSMGLTPRGFNKMILFESLFFGLKSLFFGLPVSFIFVYLIHQSMNSFTTRNSILIPWNAVMIAVVGVFLVVLIAMGYSVNKIKKENILNAIRDENI